MDEIITAIADYALPDLAPSAAASETAYLCLMDTLGCAFLALRHPACTRLLGPVVPGRLLRGGARVPGTGYELDPVTAAFNIGTLVRWLDFNDTWLAAEWGHPSDNLGGAPGRRRLSVARRAAGKDATAIDVRALLVAMIKAHEIQGVLALKMPSTVSGSITCCWCASPRPRWCRALAARRVEQIANAVSNAWWTAGRCASIGMPQHRLRARAGRPAMPPSRGVWHALLALRGEMGYPSALTAPTWGFYDVLFRGQPFSLPQPFGSYVMENVLFKVSYPAEFHAQTAVEAAMRLHPQVARRLDQVQRIVIETQEAGDRIINKTGPLANPADRDHCLQYMVAVPLIFGRLQRQRLRARRRRRSAHRRAAREDAGARESRLHARLSTIRPSATSAMPCRCSSATAAPPSAWSIDYPLGHRLRRAEAAPLLQREIRSRRARPLRGHASGSDTRTVRRPQATRIHDGRRLDGRSDAGMMRA